MRIVSLVPSLTELVAYLGRADWVVGRTRFCTEPASVQVVEAVGGTKDPDTARVVALAPDLVIANREENRREDVEALIEAGLDVLLTDPNSIDDAVVMIAGLGERLKARRQAWALTESIGVVLERCTFTEPRPRVFVAVWKTPLLGLGDESYGNDVLLRAGATNVLAGQHRYPEVTQEELAALRPDLILLPDEPYRFREKHVAEFEDIAPARVIDGKLLWWYGPRIPLALLMLNAVFQEAER